MIDGDDIIGKYTLRALGSQLLPIKNKTCYQHCNALSSVYYIYIYLSLSLSLSLSVSLSILKIVKLVISFLNRTVNQNIFC